MGWWNPFKAIANVVTKAVSAVIETVSDAFGQHELGQKIAGVFEAVVDTVVDVVVDIAVGVATSNPVTAVVSVITNIAEGVKDVYDALNPASETVEVAAADAPVLEGNADYGSDDMLM
ncbi:hypothetical protein PsW64_01044 [Pseudovibrio sp. W64]|uniref:hypothetical protein n=1 Tax=unclassified Pseudovibrio TaxID=2627060 RepID=UPI00070F5D65|nr:MULTISPECIES: hypothetical protein [unclassified Pseudovibrio]KZK75909.1 hypothetical protein PsAD13_05347 [Pseudovibrio sp. Ad13]KZK87747.1 hypothetical protein PsW64_01044 [Pseudovibrio sp. W64]KZK88469.1 hypothetical protein PsAD46_02427 [Pseudovibrio sp. Ad46]KZK90970.1 hypothetical protein PsAD5_04108 [Pseudovibrio sp. Ad5]KZL03662.1 hypothetical protein PsW74_00234 [Pseudovibrio sp. W74]